MSAPTRSTATARRVVPGGPPSVSVVVPVGHRPPDLVAFHRLHASELRRGGERAEFVFVFDGNAPPAPPELVRMAREDPRLRLLALGESFGEAAAFRAGIGHSRGETVVMLPPGAGTPPGLVREGLREIRRDADVVVGRDGPGGAESVGTRLLRPLVRRILGSAEGGAAAVSPGLRVLRRDVALSLPLYESAYRFLPALATREGYRVEVVEGPESTPGPEPAGAPGSASPERSGTPRRDPQDTTAREAWGDGHRGEGWKARPDSRRGPLAAGALLLDLLSYAFVTRFTERPLRFFGALGSALAGTGGLLGIWLLIQRFALDKGIANRPALLLAVLLVALGVQVVGLGLVGEIMVNLRAADRPGYRVRELA